MANTQNDDLSTTSNSGIRVAVDASRNRSGGAVAHLIGILNASKIEAHDIAEVHVWSHKGLLDKLPDESWLKKHNPPLLEKSIFHQLLWQICIFKGEFDRLKCDLLLNTDAGTLSKISPAVTMSRDMLSYERGEMERFGFSFSRARLLLLRYIQNASLRRADGVIFLTQYAAEVIQSSCGVLKNVQLIPHGISDLFRVKADFEHKNKNLDEALTLLYVSNTDLYKHQWHVVAAIELLRSQGHKVLLKLVGGGVGRPHKRLQEQLQISDPCGEFVETLPFIPHDQIPALHASADIFIFASSCENMPNTLIEAMSAGLPIASSDRGPMPEVLKDGGVYFDPENPQSIATAVQKLLADNELRSKLAIRAAELSKEYSWRRCAEQTWKFIGETYALVNNKRL
jgi:glycosyltransferase involved in cell wall biosynthesis